jgi:hypothetical protein
LNAGPDLQLYARVPIQNEVPDSEKFKLPIQNEVPDSENLKLPIQNEVPDSRKIKVPIQKRSYRYGTAQRKRRYLHKPKLKG